MALFRNQQNTNPGTPRAQLTAKYSSARANLLLVIIFTAINMAMALTGSDSYFLFSAFIPYFLTLIGAALSGKMPEYFYEGEGAYEIISDGALMWGLAAVSAIIVAVYLLLWLLSKKPRMGILIAALIIFAVDTAALLFIGGFSLDMIIDYLFHALVIISLASGISAAKKISELPDEPVQVEDYTDVTGA